VPGRPAPPSVYDETDAVYAAANYLHAHRAPGNWAAAPYAYNHAGWYVEQVTSLPNATPPPPTTSAPPKTSTRPPLRVR